MDRLAIGDGNASIRGQYNIGYTEKRCNDTEPFRGLKLIDSGDQNRKRVERRVHQRFQVKKSAFAIVRSRHTPPIRIEDMSMGEIAFAVIKSDPYKLGRIKDLSMNGLAFCYLGNGKRATDDSFRLDLLLADYGFYLKDIPFKTVSDFRFNNDFPFCSLKTRQLGVRFKDMTRGQVSKLRYFIRKHTIGKLQEDHRVGYGMMNPNILGPQFIDRSRS